MMRSLRCNGFISHILLSTKCNVTCLPTPECRPNTPSAAFSNFIAINGSFMGDTVASPIRDAAVAFSSSRDATLKTTEAHSDVDDDSDYDDDDSDSDYDETTGPVPISRLGHPASVVRPGTAAPHPQPQPAPASTSKATSKKVSPRRTATTSHPQALPLTRCVPLHDVARACPLRVFVWSCSAPLATRVTPRTLQPGAFVFHPSWQESAVWAAERRSSTGCAPSRPCGLLSAR